MKKHQVCLICSSDQLAPLPRYFEKHGLVHCKKCGFVFMDRIPTADELSVYYSNYSYGREAALSPLTIKSYSLLLDEFEKYRKNNRLLDVGCGRGWFLQEALKRGWKAYGTEYSSAAVDLCRNNGIEMKQGPLKASDFAGLEFDVITSFEVIEHINNPKEELSEMYQLLRKGGMFYCTTPNFNSLLRYYLKENYNIIEYPEHLCYYTGKTLNKVVNQAGFSSLKTLTTGISITRFQASQQDQTPSSENKVKNRESADEKLRRSIDSNPLLGMAKKIANSMLTATGTGLALKGYFTK